MAIHEKRGEEKFSDIFSVKDRISVGIVQSVNTEDGTLSGYTMAGKQFVDARVYMAGGSGWMMGYMPQENDMVLIFPIHADNVLLAFPLYLMYCGYDWMKAEQLQDEKYAKANLTLDPVIKGRRVNKGEFYIRASSGSELIMNRLGDFRIKNDINDLLELNSGFRSLIAKLQNSLDFKTGQSRMQMGVVRRPKDVGDGQMDLPLTFPARASENYEELNVKISPKDSTETTFVTLKAGDVVEDDGTVTSLRLRLVFTESGEEMFKLEINKEGEVVYEGSMAYLGYGELGLGVKTLAEATTAKTKGYLILGNLFLTLYNAHVHPTVVGPTGPPAVLALPATYLSQVTYTK